MTKRTSCCKSEKTTGGFAVPSIYSGTVKYYAQIHLQVWQNSVCTGQGNLPLINYLVAEDRERVKGGEAACEALDVNSVFCYQPACLPASQCASCSCTFFRPIGFRRHDAVWRIPASKPNDHQEKCLLRVSCAGSRDSDAQ